MKRIVFIVYLIFTISGLYAQETEVRNTIRIKITDKLDRPVFGVYVAIKNKNRLLTNSDIDGECTIHKTSVEHHDSIVFQGIGYKTQTIAWHQLHDGTVVRMEGLEFELEESRVYAITTHDLLNKAMNRLKKLPRKTLPQANFYGKAQYEKITEYRERVVEYRREYGYYFTSGDIQPKNVWDNNFRSYFVPAYSARSFNMINNGMDTLSPLYMTSEEIRYDAGTRKIFTLLRAVQLYGPLFSGINSYEISAIESDSPDYMFSFKTLLEDYPSKTNITCKGTFTIDIEQHVLKHISFDFIDYQLYRQILLSRQRKTESPFSTRAEIAIGYDESERPYIRSCSMETYWKYDLGENFVLIEQPSRKFPAIGKLIEREAFACYSFQNVREPLRKNITKIHAVQRNPSGVYDSLLFAALPQLLDNKKAIKDLAQYAHLEEQYEFHSGKTYYPDNYLIGFNGVGRNDPVFHESNELIRQQLFKLFPPPTPPLIE